MNSVTDKNNPPPQSRLFLGGAVFITGLFSPLAIPLVTDSNLAIEWKTMLSAMLALGIPEVFMLIAVAILGKQGFDYLKSYLWKAIRPADKVSSTRYRIGLVLFFTPLLFGWLHPYLEWWIPELGVYRVKLAIAGDILFASSLFVLGGNFWLKLKLLFSNNV